MATKNQEGSLATDLMALLRSGVGADVTLVAGGRALRAHRAVLMARSTVLCAQLSKITGVARDNRITLDMEPDVLQQLAVFLYSDEVPQLHSIAARLLPAADKYGLPLLKKHCEQQLVSQLSLENAAAMAVLSVQHTCHDLKEAAITFVQKNALKVMFTEGWAEALRQHPETVAEISLLAKEGVPPQHKNDISEEEADDLGWELYEAAAAGKVGRMQRLLAMGANVEASDEDDDTALYMAASEGHVEAVRCLLQAGAQADRRNQLKQTPLHKAAEKGHTAVIRLLAAASAKLVDIPDENGDTPLHVTAKYGHAEATRALLTAGADRDIRNNADETPLDVANQHDREDLLLILKSNNTL